MTVIEINIEGGNMTDWIDDLKKHVEKGKEEAKKAEEIRLNKDKIIAAKLPDFWEVLLEQIDAQCSELKQKLPNDEEYHCSMQHTHSGVILARERRPIRRLFIGLNVNAQCINIREEDTSEMSPRYSSGSRRRSEIQVNINTNNELIFRYRDSDYMTPQDLAHALIRELTAFK
jgi:hypothetical protein